MPERLPPSQGDGNPDQIANFLTNYLTQGTVKPQQPDVPEFGFVRAREEPLPHIQQAFLTYADGEYQKENDFDGQAIRAVDLLPDPKALQIKYFEFYSVEHWKPTKYTTGVTTREYFTTPDFPGRKPKFDSVTQGQFFMENGVLSFVELTDWAESGEDTRTTLEINPLGLQREYGLRLEAMRMNKGAVEATYNKKGELVSFKYSNFVKMEVPAGTEDEYEEADVYSTVMELKGNFGVNRKSPNAPKPRNGFAFAFEGPHMVVTKPNPEECTVEVMAIQRQLNPKLLLGRFIHPLLKIDPYNAPPEADEKYRNVNFFQELENTWDTVPLEAA